MSMTTFTATKRAPNSSPFNFLTTISRNNNNNKHIIRYTFKEHKVIMKDVSTNTDNSIIKDTVKSTKDVSTNTDIGKDKQQHNITIETLNIYY